METNLGLFLLSAVGISLAVIVLPGPIAAAIIAKGYSDKNAGALIAVGHAVIEMPLIAAICLGFGRLISSPQVVSIIHVLGGLMLFYLGFRMFRTGGNAVRGIGGLPASSLVAGIVVTATNPAFYVWWVTVGMVLIASATNFGVTGIVLFTLVHWLCDLGWYEFLSASTFKSRKRWTRKVRRIVFSICAFVLIGFGVWFCIAGFL